MNSFTFPKTLRLRKRGDYLAVGRKGRFFSKEKCSAQWLRTDLKCVRLGLTVSARTGSAVERNLFKRRVREAFRVSSLRQRKGLDLNIRPQKPLSATYHELLSFFNALDTYLFPS